MTLDIDVDALRRERSEIKKRLLRIESLLELANHSNPTPVPQEAVDKALSIWHKEFERINTSPIPPALMGALNSVPVERTARPASQYRSFRQGTRRDVLLALSTGAASELELTKVLTQWKAYQIVLTVRDLLTRKLAFLTEHGQIQLSDTGREEAKWFAANPLYRVHRRRH
jgi:hypothetical protein